ncbi:MAG: SDR family NAD(P)-dependent oxidoreductase [Fermentimonas sp.]|jgi:rhamnose utilization protein RhaD (predicted bifunctional aldolase and dehydrogenase)/NAD(P)-dependent dehydrogenase (short-subunit alcohol dehydrogenase family)
MKRELRDIDAKELGKLEELVEISRFYGKDNRFVIAGGGNTSYKNDEKIWVKASGHALATITVDGFAVLDRSKLAPMATKAYSEQPDEREEQVKNDLAAATFTKGRRPSVETSLHDAINWPFVVHLHPTVVNGLLCARNAEQGVEKLFGKKTLYVPYTDPGYVLFKAVSDKIASYRATYNEEPRVIWLQNHGIFVGADSTEEIRELYDAILKIIEGAMTMPLPVGELETCRCVADVLPALRMLLSGEELKTLKVRNNTLIKHYSDDPENQRAIARPFTPDGIVYCKSNYLFLNGETPEELIAEGEKAIPAFTERFGYPPKVLLVKGIGLVAVGDHAKQCDTILDVFEDAMKVAYIARSFGGPHPMTPEQVEFIDNWEVENYRRSVGAGSARGRVENRTIVITGAAQGFGEGIGRCLLREGANIVVADLNEEAGKTTVEEFNRLAGNNRALFVKTNVADLTCLENLIHASVCQFGAIDCFISNAGVLRAGGLEEMTAENFDFVTKINYNAYFFCAKVASKVMKLQTKYAHKDYYADIIQVNSKSGLEGSRANFAYAGGKFGGIGLTQSFALELAPYRIKVNAVCPGNFYEGPLWSDPDNGLFVQYLKAGKVPGARTVDEVKEYYLSKVPMRKGCTPEQVTKGVLYLMEQCGETGQALPITGGQVMLS